MKSIIQPEGEYCYICKEKYGIDAPQLTHVHHIFFGPLRPISEKYGLTVKLCLRHHVTGPEAVHKCQAMNRWLQKRAQICYMQNHTKAEWIKIMHRDYSAAAYIKTPVDIIWEKFGEDYPNLARKTKYWFPHPSDDHAIVLKLRARDGGKLVEYTEAYGSRKAELKTMKEDRT